MKNELECAASMEADFLSLFYSITIYESRIKLQGHLTVASLERCRQLTPLELTEHAWLTGIYTQADISIEICLTI